MIGSALSNWRVKYPRDMPEDNEVKRWAEVNTGLCFWREI